MPKEIHPYEVLRRPVVTEKSTALSGQNKYVFEVVLGANKPQIKEAVQRAFNVTVQNVNTLTMRDRMVSANSSRRKWWSVPATSLRNTGALVTRKS